jgi:hypothetical protein
MITDRIVYEPRARVTLDHDDVEALARCAENHYDHRCRAAGERGGLVYGMRTRMGFAREDGQTTIDRTLASDEVDLLIKIAEADPDTRLHHELHALHTRLATAHHRINQSPSRTNPNADDGSPRETDQLTQGK